MRKAVALTLIVCMFGSMGLYAADSMEGLTYEQQQEYINRSLSIETESHTTVSGGAYDFGRPGGYISSFAEGETTTEWIPYQGARQISRPAFFEIVGYPDIAAEEQHIIDVRNSMNIAKWSCVGIGFAGMFSGILLALLPENNMPAAIAGIALFSLGCAADIAALILEFTPPESDISIAFAVNLANTYNQNLLNSF